MLMFLPSTKPMRILGPGRPRTATYTGGPSYTTIVEFELRSRKCANVYLNVHVYVFVFVSALARVFVYSSLSMYAYVDVDVDADVKLRLNVNVM